ncbi:helicase [Mucilaginibacter galii]|uniref:Helicase n=1 Tax=Mucilaginibacter galii TaxID=2005073 RepID=A0A917JAQ9_9SPHI|nr:helicase [Mucilaginibacter galii]GGI51898.1 hypothetical protein GCM10011425_31100 [Mucilaginibacter galii]
MEHFKIDVEYGGISKGELLEILIRSDIQLNEFAKLIFSSNLFPTITTKKTVLVIILTIEQLGFPEGATILEITKHINRIGLTYCPLEVGPNLRLQLKDQQEISGHFHVKYQSPLDAITIFSKPIIDDNDFPKGFYLRKIEGQLWLRGYTCTSDHMWNPKDMMAFQVVKLTDDMPRQKKQAL